ncbi:hypothetical protein HDU67_004172, partial [Dinochytrium kinnereticum]
MGNKLAKAAPKATTAAAPAATRVAKEAAPEMIQRQVDMKRVELSRENEKVISNFNALTWSIHSKEVKEFRKDNELLDVLKIRLDQEHPNSSKLAISDLE